MEVQRLKEPPKESITNIKIRPLSQHEIDKGISVFSRAIARNWPNTSEEATAWVHDEFYHPSSVILGAFNAQAMIGVCSLVPFDYVLENLEENERKSVKDQLEKTLGANLPKAIFFGGLGVEEKYEGRGIAARLFRFAENFARDRGASLLIAETAEKSGKYPKAGALELLQNRFHMNELALPQRTFFNSPNDLGKIWLYKTI